MEVLAKRIREHRTRASLGNAAYAVAEYLAQPLAGILAAPFLVHRLGLDQYGLWMLVNAVVGGMGILSAGFGDATIKYVSTYRGKGDRSGVINSIRGTITINLILGSLFAGLVWALSPFAVHHLFKISLNLQGASILMLRIASFILLLRSIESVFISTLRAYERYGPPAKLNIVSRAGVIVAAVLLTSLGYGVVAIMAATLIIACASITLQGIAVRIVVGPMLFLPHFGRDVLSELASFGIFTWLQGLSSVAFTHVDRLLVGATLGTSTLAIYTICVQATQPIHGLIAAALNFLFPHISSRHEAGERASSRRMFRFIMPVNILLAAGLILPFILFSQQLLKLWMGAEFAQAGHALLSLLAVSFALLALTVAPHYTLLALGRVKFVSSLNIATGAGLLLVMLFLLPRAGILGAGACRIMYSGTLAVVYLGKALRSVRAAARTPEMEPAFSRARTDAIG